MFSQKKQNVMHDKRPAWLLLFTFFCFENLFSAQENQLSQSTVNSDEDVSFVQAAEDQVFDVVEETALSDKHVSVIPEVVEEEVVEQEIVPEQKNIPLMIDEVSVPQDPPIIDLATVDEQDANQDDSSMLDDAAIGAGVAGLLTAAAVAAPKIKTIVKTGKEIRDIVKGEKLSEKEKKALIDKNIEYQEKLVYTRRNAAEEKVKQYHDAGDFDKEAKWQKRLNLVRESDQLLQEQKVLQDQLNRDVHIKKLTPEAKRDLRGMQIEAAHTVYEAEKKQLYGSLKKYDDKDSLKKSDKLQKNKKEVEAMKIKKYENKLNKLDKQNQKEHKKELKRKEMRKRVVARGARVYPR